MKAFIFTPSNEFIAKIEVRSVEQLPNMLREFLTDSRAVPPYSYVELSGTSWTIIDRDPLRLQDGIVRPALSPAQSDATPTAGQETHSATAASAPRARATPGSLYVGIVTFVIIH